MLIQNGAYDPADRGPDGGGYRHECTAPEVLDGSNGSNGSKYVISINIRNQDFRAQAQLNFWVDPITVLSGRF